MIRYLIDQDDRLNTQDIVVSTSTTRNDSVSNDGKPSLAIHYLTNSIICFLFLAIMTGLFYSFIFKDTQIVGFQTFFQQNQILVFSQNSLYIPDVYNEIQTHIEPDTKKINYYVYQEDYNRPLSLNVRIIHYMRKYLSFLKRNLCIYITPVNVRSIQISPKELEIIQNSRVLCEEIIILFVEYHGDENEIVSQRMRIENEHVPDFIKILTFGDSLNEKQRHFLKNTWNSMGKKIKTF